jgi:hypothetical protein
MFGSKKNKKNKFHLPVADPKQDSTDTVRTFRKQNVVAKLFSTE